MCTKHTQLYSSKENSFYQNLRHSQAYHRSQWLVTLMSPCSVKLPITTKLCVASNKGPKLSLPTGHHNSNTIQYQQYHSQHFIQWASFILICIDVSVCDRHMRASLWWHVVWNDEYNRFGEDVPCLLVVDTLTRTSHCSAVVNGEVIRQ